MTLEITCMCNEKLPAGNTKRARNARDKHKKGCSHLQKAITDSTNLSARRKEHENKKIAQTLAKINPSFKPGKE